MHDIDGEPDNRESCIGRIRRSNQHHDRSIDTLDNLSLRKTPSAYRRLQRGSAVGSSAASIVEPIQDEAF